MVVRLHSRIISNTDWILTNSLPTSKGVEMRMHPEFIADVRYDSYARIWFVIPPGAEPISLDLSEYRAADEEITAALYQLPLVYRCLIRRYGRETRSQRK
jgi:hypothetical protein